ncbi:conserved hypothetical protein [Uncinocarpus reesii 1704]|uniref:Putative lipoate-protein ligase A n=1 Tax=Uncinocarpus reesii (strain UAMH 1704) TaxID=336963 RepID=C4JJX8_UNCRE|nr:uncharacterized protein UREG_01935 [Uncinocarpus reesii 1704]EEP77086.1 conserved hypothetical protein [Uncinocarpus reesii 1704]
MSQLHSSLSQTGLAPAVRFGGSRSSAEKKYLRPPEFHPRLPPFLQPRPGHLRANSPRQQRLHLGPSFQSAVQSAEHQIYRSVSTDPHVNLAIENYLYSHSPDNSKVLFLYVNRPSVIIGRNQIPWLEMDLHLLNRNRPVKNATDKERPPLALLRRRSGGGTVFHDEGNINYSVISPKSEFHRDRHAEMVVRALHKIGAANTSVNTRHDIVMSRDSPVPPPKQVVPTRTDDIESPPVETTPNALKISGSAYKLSRFRALHHGTCLIDSPNINSIGAILSSPARPYLYAKGVDSVRSPVGNISSTLPGLPGKDIMQALALRIMEEFTLLYNSDRNCLMKVQEQHDEPYLFSHDQIEADIHEYEVRCIFLQPTAPLVNGLDIQTIPSIHIFYPSHKGRPAAKAGPANPSASFGTYTPTS